MPRSAGIRTASYGAMRSQVLQAAYAVCTASYGAMRSQVLKAALPQFESTMSRDKDLLVLTASLPEHQQPCTLRFQTRDPRLYTLNLKPSTLNLKSSDPKPQTLNPRPQTLDPRPQTLASRP
eukprot:2979218-Rhodomonas_salina.8